MLCWIACRGCLVGAQRPGAADAEGWVAGRSRPGDAWVVATRRGRGRACAARRPPPRQLPPCRPPPGCPDCCHDSHKAELAAGGATSGPGSPAGAGA